MPMQVSTIASRLTVSIGFVLLCLSFFLPRGLLSAQNEPSPARSVATRPLPLGESIETISEYFLGIPFRDSALGEGLGSAQGKGQGLPYDSDPLFRLDAFDCTTFVETVWAMSLSPPPADWTKTLQIIRYRGGRPSFVNRLHFISLDWVPYHIGRGALEDITLQLGAPVTESATLIDKKAWYRTLHPKEYKNLLAQYPQEAAQRVLTTYLSFAALLDSPRAIATLKMKLKTQALLINFIRPDWDTVRWLGTRIDVSHQGFILLKGDQIVMRHASAPHKQVTETNFLDYLRFHRQHPTLKGLQILRLKTL